MIGLLLAVVAVGAAAFFHAQVDVTGEHPDQRVASIIRLTNNRPPGTADALARSAANDPAPSVRQAAVVALGSFRRPEDRAVIEQLTRDVDPNVRRSAAKTLMSVYEDAATVQRLSDMLRQDTDPLARQAAATALVAGGDSRAYVNLVQALEAGGEHVGLAVAQAFDAHYHIGVEINRSDPVAWERYVEIIKHIDAVIDAFEQTGTPLNPNLAIRAEMAAEHAPGSYHDHQADPDHPQGGTGP